MKKTCAVFILAALAATAASAQAAAVKPLVEAARRKQEAPPK